jgi:hypothetical protein
MANAKFKKKKKKKINTRILEVNLKEKTGTMLHLERNLVR